MTLSLHGDRRCYICGRNITTVGPQGLWSHGRGDVSPVHINCARKIESGTPVVRDGFDIMLSEGWLTVSEGSVAMPGKINGRPSVSISEHPYTSTHNTPHEGRFFILYDRNFTRTQVEKELPGRGTPVLLWLIQVDSAGNVTDTQDLRGLPDE